MTTNANGQPRVWDWPDNDTRHGDRSRVSASASTAPARSYEELLRVYQAEMLRRCDGQREWANRRGFMYPLNIGPFRLWKREQIEELRLAGWTKVKGLDCMYPPGVMR